MEPPPAKLDLKKDRGLTIQWADGSTSYYSIAYLRKMSPSADARQLREDLARNPLAILPSGPAGVGGGSGAGLTAVNAELVGRYALRIEFSDGHNTGIYSWDYLREIDPAAQRPGDAPPGASTGAGAGEGADASADAGSMARNAGSPAGGRGDAPPAAPGAFKRTPVP